MTHQLPDDVVAALKTAAGEVRAGGFRRRPHDRERGLDLAAICPAWAADPVPPSHMPGWLARLLSSLGGGLDRPHWATFLDSIAWAGGEWRALDAAAWDRVRLQFQRGAIDQALAFAAPLQPDPPPRYWREVAPRARAVLAALDGEGDVRAAAHELECWSIPEGYDLWEQENATYEAEWAAKCLADAAYGAGPGGDWTEGGTADEIANADRGAMAPLSRLLFQALADAISAAKWG